MDKKFQFTAVIEREGKEYVSLCPELDIASQGVSVGGAKSNLKEAVELFFETASRKEIDQRLHEEVIVTRLEVNSGKPLARHTIWDTTINIPHGIGG